MLNVERGTKHVCPDCGLKFYDMKAETVACPSCGATPNPVRLPRNRVQRRRPVGTPIPQ